MGFANSVNLHSQFKPSEFTLVNISLLRICPPGFDFFPATCLPQIATFIVNPDKFQFAAHRLNPAGTHIAISSRALFERFLTSRFSA
jgi:hypothetical protein